MKKAGAFLLVLTITFVGFIAGMLVGRNINRDVPTIQVQANRTSIEVTLPPTSADNEERININTASAKMVDTLPGIGPVLAQRIIDYRIKNGPFSEPSEISKVEGIGSETLLGLLDFITVED